MGFQKVIVEEIVRSNSVWLKRQFWIWIEKVYKCCSLGQKDLLFYLFYQVLFDLKGISKWLVSIKFWKIISEPWVLLNYGTITCFLASFLIPNSPNLSLEHFFKECYFDESTHFNKGCQCVINKVWKKKTSLEIWKRLFCINSK